MNILYVITQGDAGGAQKYVLELAKAFHGEIATGTESNNLALEAEDAGIRVHRLYHLKRSISPLDDVLALWDLVQLVKTRRPDIVHLNSSKAGFLGSLLKFFADVKIVYTAHGFVFNEPGSSLKKKLYAWLERFASRRRDYIIAVSQYDLAAGLAEKVISPGKISVVHNGIAETLFLNKTSARQYLGLSLDKAVIGTLANLYHTKGIDTLIEAAASIPEEQRQFLQFAVMGEGPLRTTYERLIAKRNLTGMFKLLGHRELASHYLRGFDIFILPSRKEGFPLALLEAMQAGLPIIATNVGGNSEAVGDAGILLPPEDPEKIADTITGLIFGHGPDGGLEKLQQLSKNSLLRSREFPLEKMVAQTQAIYDLVLTRIR